MPWGVSAGVFNTPVWTIDTQTSCIVDRLLRLFSLYTFSRCSPKIQLLNHTHRQACCITCSSGPEIPFAKLNWHRMTNKIFYIFIRSAGRSQCRTADQGMFFNLAHNGLIDGGTPGCLWSGNKPAFHRLLPFSQWWMGGERKMAREWWRNKIVCDWSNWREKILVDVCLENGWRALLGKRAGNGMD